MRDTKLRRLTRINYALFLENYHIVQYVLADPSESEFFYKTLCGNKRYYGTKCIGHISMVQKPVHVYSCRIEIAKNGMTEAISQTSHVYSIRGAYAHA